MVLGSQVYDGEGRTLATGRGLGADGLSATGRDDADAVSMEHARSVPALGRADPVRRRTDCGERGTPRDRAAGPPESCPDCGAPRADVHYRTED